MSGKQNCWEFKKCGRGFGGANVGDFGVCPAATDFAANSLNGGENGGRICWAIAGTFCGDEVQGEFAHKVLSCLTCEFFKSVTIEENDNFMLMKPGQVYKQHQ